MLKNLWRIAGIFWLAGTVFTQTDAGVETKNLAAYYNGNYSGRKQFALPAQIDRFLPKVLLVTRSGKLASTYREDKLVSFIKRTRFLIASEYTTAKLSDRLWFPSVEFNGKRYIFAGEHFDTEADAKIFNLFLKEANLKIENEREAAELANLFFSVTRGYFENKGKLILSGVEDVPLSYRKAKEGETKRLQKIIVSPTAKMIDGSYEVELYTWEMALGEVTKWSFKIQSDTRIEVQTGIIGKL